VRSKGEEGKEERGEGGWEGGEGNHLPMKGIREKAPAGKPSRATRRRREVRIQRTESSEAIVKTNLSL
jgi:hypothetical protein